MSRDFLCWLFYFLFCLFVFLFLRLEIFAAGKDGLVFAAEGKKKIYEFSANTFVRKYGIICGVKVK